MHTASSVKNWIAAHNRCCGQPYLSDLAPADFLFFPQSEGCTSWPQSGPGKPEENMGRGHEIHRCGGCWRDRDVILKHLTPKGLTISAVICMSRRMYTTLWVPIIQHDLIRDLVSSSSTLYFYRRLKILLNSRNKPRANL